MGLAIVGLGRVRCAEPQPRFLGHCYSNVRALLSVVGTPVHSYEQSGT